MKIFKTYRKGDKGYMVRVIQEWLNLNGIELAMDGDFGPATHYGVIMFQKRNGLAVDGIVGSITFDALIAPMTRANEPLDYFEYVQGKVIDYAKQHLAQEPKEVGGQNMGPWVRMYMDGYQGDVWPWCAGFVLYILGQVFGKDKLPIIKSFSVDNIVKDAIKKGIFIKGVGLEIKEIIKKITPGSLWVLRKEWGDWTHIGIIVDIKDDIFIAIEGNTNRKGDREGTKVAQKIRSYSNKDFIVYRDI